MLAPVIFFVQRFHGGTWAGDMVFYRSNGQTVKRSNLLPRSHRTYGSHPPTATGSFSTQEGGHAIDGDRAHRSGDRTTVEALVHQYGFRLLGLAVSQLGDRATAEEIVQDVFFRAHQQLQRGRPVRWSWLAQAVVWRTRRARQARWRRHEVPADLPPAPPSRSESPEPSLLAQIRALEPAHAEALLLHHWAGFSVEETAAILGIPVGTVKSRLWRARAALKHQGAEDESRAQSPPA